MIEAVLLFGFMNVLFEFVLISMVPPRWRLRLLGSAIAKGYVHVMFLSLNLLIHWGTLIGTMSAVLAFISSIATMGVANRVFGNIKEGRYYTVGLIKYSVEELK